MRRALRRLVEGLRREFPSADVVPLGSPTHEKHNTIFAAEHIAPFLV